MNRDLLQMLVMSTSYEEGTGLISADAESIDDESAAAILKKANDPETGDRARWFKDWYVEAQGAVFLNKYFDLLGVDAQGASDFFDELPPQIAGGAVNILLPRIERLYQDLNKTISDAYALAQTLGAESVQDKKREFEERTPTVKGYIRVTRALTVKSQDKNLMAEVLLWKGIFALFHRDFYRIFKELDSQEEIFQEAQSSFEEALALTGDFPVKIKCLSNLAYLWFEEDLSKSFDYLNQAETDLLEKSKHAQNTEEKEQLDALYYQTTSNLSCVLKALNRFEDCYSLLFRAIETLEKELWAIAAPNLTAEYFEKHHGLYADMVEVCIELAKADEAFKEKALEYAEMINARVFLEGWKTCNSLGAGADPILEKKREELIENFDYLKMDPSAEELEELKRIQHEIGLVEQQMWEQSKIKVYCNEARPAAFQEIVELVPPNGVLIEYFVNDDKIFIFVIDDKCLLGVAEVKFEPGQLWQIIDMANMAIGCRLNYTAYNKLEKEDIHLPWVELKNLEFLYKLLIDPVSAYFDSKELIYLVPHGDLRRVPFQALYYESQEGKKYLIDEKAICYAPSASILRILTTRQRSLKTCFAAGVPENSGGPSKGLEEAQMVAKLFQVIPGPASRKAFLSEAGEYDVIHISCHSSPKSAVSIFNGLMLEDGVLLPQDVADLKCSLVTLSACHTYRDDLSVNREMAGLTGSFLRAGARSVIASLWPVDAAAAYIIMENFYKNLIQGKSKAEALQKAQIAVKMEYSDHPLFWAPFFLVGTCD